MKIASQNVLLSLFLYKSYCKMSLLNQVSLLEIYTYIGLLSGWWFSSQHLAPALKKNKVEDKKIHWVVGIMFLIAWPLIIWRNNARSANNIAKELKQEERKNKH